MVPIPLPLSLCYSTGYNVIDDARKGFQTNRLEEPNLVLSDTEVKHNAAVCTSCLLAGLCSTYLHLLLGVFCKRQTMGWALSSYQHTLLSYTSASRYRLPQPHLPATHWQLIHHMTFCSRCWSSVHHHCVCSEQ